MTADEIFTKLKELAPSVVFDVTKKHDHDEVWDGDGEDPAERGLTPYNVDVIASTVLEGEMVEGFGYLGGCYMAYNEPIGDIGGYLPQLLDEAAKELDDQLPSWHPGRKELKVVKAFLKEEMRNRYDEQMAERN